ncbi:MAG: PD-(D/E)XK nuclease family protein [Deltaproteobacteria bacterium]
MSKLNEMYFSQNSLEIFNKCKLKFKKRYVDGLLWKSHEDKENKHAEKGRLFHLLAYRFFMGLDDSFVDEKGEYSDIKVWQDRLKSYIAIDSRNEYYPEFELKLCEDNIKIQAKYDLIMLDAENRAVIYDWKVQEKAIKPNNAEKAFQTRVYMYLLAKAGDIIKGKAIRPQDITMVYWQANHPANPVRIEYSEELFKQDEEFVKNEIEKILSCNFDSTGLKTTDEKVCRFCEFCSICNGVDAEEVVQEDGFEIEWETVEEIEF